MTTKVKLQHSPTFMRRIQRVHYSGKSYSDEFECPKCGHRQRQNLSFLGRRGIKYDGQHRCYVGEKNMTTKTQPQHSPKQCPETEAAQEVHGPVKDQQEHRDRQAAQLYRHVCKLEAERDALRAANAELVQALLAKLGEST